MLPAAVDWSYPTIPTVLGISPHGLLSAAGVLVAWMFLRRTLQRRGLDLNAAEAALGWGIPAALAGARIDYVISHPSQFGTLWQMLQVWRGGMALFGGLLAGVLAALIVLRRRGVRVAPVLDAAAAPLAVGIAVGRIGDLMLGDHLGRPLTGTWGIGYLIQPGSILAPGFAPSPARTAQLGESCTDAGVFYAGCTYHLTAAYDLIAAAVIALVLIGLARWTRLRPGLAISIFALLYAGQRLALDAARGIDERPFAGLTGTQLIAIIVVTAAAVSIAITFGLHRRHHRAATTTGAPRQPSSTTAELVDRDTGTPAVELSVDRPASTPDVRPDPAVGDPTGTGDGL